MSVPISFIRQWSHAELVRIVRAFDFFGHLVTMQILISKGLAEPDSVFPTIFRDSRAAGRWS